LVLYFFKYKYILSFNPYFYVINEKLILNWLDANIKKDFKILYTSDTMLIPNYIIFLKESDAMAFKLKWL